MEDEAVSRLCISRIDNAYYREIYLLLWDVFVNSDQFIVYDAALTNVWIRGKTDMIVAAEVLWVDLNWLR